MGVLGLMKIIDFKTVSPLFEMERDGIKPFTVRLDDQKDSRFRALSQWEFSTSSTNAWYCRITNPKTGESFTRMIDNIDWVWDSTQNARTNWKIIYFGNLI